MSQLLHSKILGAGSPLLILHGFLGMLDNWKTLGKKFAENGFEVHLIDQRNHGKSFHSEAFNYALLSNDLLHYMNHYSLEKANIIGHSMGGKTAMQFASDHAERTERLIVADIAPKHYPPHHQTILESLNALDFQKIHSRAEADQELSKSINAVGTRQFLLKNLYWIEKGQLGFRCNLAVLRNRMEEIGENISSTAIYNGPTLFLRGDRSNYIIDEDLDKIRLHFPEAVIESISDAGHWLHAENPKQFFEKCLKLLDS